MGKKDFSNSTENVFSDFFSQPIQPVKKIEKKVETKPAEEKKEVKVTPKKDETKKEKLPKQAETVKEEVKTTPKTEEVKEVEKAKEEVTPRKNKSRLKECRFDFYAEVEYADFLNNFLWLRRCKNYSQYFNNLIKKDFLEFLNLPADTSNEVLAQKWEEYKKENDL